jgi:hypothetical protein
MVSSSPRRAHVGRTGSLGLALGSFVAGSALAATAGAVTTLTVDLSAPIGPVTHAASGSLYGVLETQPADVMGLIAPLHPKMFNNPAADVQQPVGDAIVVAGRLAPIGATVTIRLADWFKGFYTFTTMTDWFDKIGQTVSRKKAAGLTNIYAYEIWNEPNGTWSSSNPLSFNEFWRQTYVQLRQLDPGVKITGPSASYYNQSFISGFLSFCKTNNCLPDIVGWHRRGETGRIGPSHRPARARPGGDRVHQLLGRRPSRAAGEPPGNERRSQRRMVVLQVVRRNERQHALHDPGHEHGWPRPRRLRQPGPDHGDGERAVRR